jgi:UDP-N-acetylglucosamine acyltransferase
MSARVDPLAVVDPSVDLDDAVEIGPFCVIGPRVRIGRGTVVAAHVVVSSDTEIGANCVVSPFAALGGPPQDLSYKGEHTKLYIADGVEIREHVTIHRGTVRSRGETRVGAGCYLMANSHVAHDCIVGEKVTLSHNCVLGGHVVVQDGAIIGGLAAVHQFTRIGRGAFVGGLAAVTEDVIPFGMALGNHAELAGLNLVGLKRRGFSRDQIQRLRAAYRDLFKGPGVFEERLQSVKRTHAESPEAMEIVAFIEENSKRTLCMPRRDR